MTPRRPSRDPGRARRVVVALAWGIGIGAAFALVLGPLDALGGVLVLPASYGLGLRLLLAALWGVGVIAMVLHAWRGD